MRVRAVSGCYDPMPWRALFIRRSRTVPFFACAEPGLNTRLHPYKSVAALATSEYVSMPSMIRNKAGRSK